MATPKPYVLIMHSGNRGFDLYADERLIEIVDIHPALHRDHTDFSIIGSELIRYWLNPRYDANEVETELRAALDAKWEQLLVIDELWGNALDEIEKRVDEAAPPDADAAQD